MSIPDKEHDDYMNGLMETEPPPEEMSYDASYQDGAYNTQDFQNEQTGNVNNSIPVNNQDTNNIPQNNESTSETKVDNSQKDVSKAISTDEKDTNEISQSNESVEIKKDDAKRINDKLKDIYYFDEHNVSPIGKAYLETYRDILNNISEAEIDNNDIISKDTDRIIVNKLLNGGFKENDIFDTVKTHSPIKWEDEELKQAFNGQKVETKPENKEETKEFLRNYAIRLETIQYVLQQDKEYPAVEKAYLTAYHDLLANFDIETSQYREIVNKDMEKEIAENLLEQGFSEDEIVETMEKYSPLQMKKDEINKLLHPAQKEDIEHKLETTDLKEERLCTDSELDEIIQKYSNNAVMVKNAILKKVRTTYDSFVRLNRIRNFPKFVAKLSDNPKYFYLREAAELRTLQLQGRFLSNRDEIELYRKSQNDLIIASKLLEKNCSKEEIASLMEKYSPLKPTAKEIEKTLQNADTLHKMEKLAKVNIEDVNVKNVADEYVSIAKEIMLDNMTTGALWNNDSNTAVIKALLDKGYAANKIVPVITKLSPSPINENEAKKLITNITGQDITLRDFLESKIKCKNVSDAKIIDDALKKDFLELKDKDSIIKKRTFIQNELKSVKKQNQKLSR